MKPLSVEMACLFGIQNEIQAVWNARSVKRVFSTAKLCCAAQCKVIRRVGANERIEIY